jgi:hypothetical protein
MSNVLRSSVSLLEQAKQELTTAEDQLDKVIRELKSAPRAEKMAVTTVIEKALAELRAARSNVETAEQALVTIDPTELKP